MNQRGIISLLNLRFAYDGDHRTVLNDLSLEIPPGAVTAILGPNGAGKTTLLHVILGLLPPRAGQVLLDGRAQVDLSRREMSRLIGLVPQAEFIPFDFSVLEYVLLGRSPYLGMLEMPGDEDYRIALEALQTLGLADLQQRAVTELSGGERQMVMLARTLAQQPRILLLDEPTSHLDLSNKGRLLRVLRQLAERGVTVIFTTHDPEAAISIARYLIMMRAGRTLASGLLGDVLTTDNLQTTYGTPVHLVRVDDRPVVLLDDVSA
jgi:iron complex transport system ATP-binding protein